MSLIVFVNNIF